MAFFKLSLYGRQTERFCFASNMRIILLQLGIDSDIAHLHSHPAITSTVVARLLHHDKGLLVHTIPTPDTTILIQRPDPADLRPARGRDLGPIAFAAGVVVAAAAATVAGSWRVAALAVGGGQESGAADEERAQGRQVSADDGDGDFDVGPDCAADGRPCKKERWEVSVGARF